jgi:hypothetical protein
MESGMNRRPEAGKKIEGIKTLQDVEKGDFEVKAMLASRRSDAD